MPTLKKVFIEQFRGWRTTEVLWLIFCLASITALSVHANDTALGLTAAVTGMLYTVLAGKGKCACFIFGLINAPLYASLAFSAGYYGDFALNLYYFALMIPALRAWRRHASPDPEVSTRRTRLSAGGRLRLAVLCLTATLALWAALRFMGGARPFCDALTNVLSVAAMILTVRRAIEEWVLWIIVDAVEIFMWWRSWLSGDGNLSILLMWILFLANGIYLLSLWMRLAKKSSRAAAPAA